MGSVLSDVSARPPNFTVPLGRACSNIRPVRFIG